MNHIISDYMYFPWDKSIGNFIVSVFTSFINSKKYYWLIYYAILKSFNLAILFE